MSEQPGKKDLQTVTPDGTPVTPAIDGVRIRYAVAQPDERGMVTEVFNPEWMPDGKPLVYVYEFTIRAGVAKGWIVHRLQDDRVYLARGAVKFVLYDDRPDSPSYRQIMEVTLTEFNRALIIYPAGIYHALQNVGESEALLYNMPTRPYNHADPDKYRLPLNNDLIPYRFPPTVTGW